MKSVQIRIYFWSVFSCIQSEYRKIQTRNNSVFGHFSRSVWNFFIFHILSYNSSKFIRNGLKRVRDHKFVKDHKYMTSGYFPHFTILYDIVDIWNFLMFCQREKMGIFDVRMVWYLPSPSKNILIILPRVYLDVVCLWYVIFSIQHNLLHKNMCATFVYKYRF